MRVFAKNVAIAAGGVFVALALYALLALPGLVSDRDSTAPLQAWQRQR